MFAVISELINYYLFRTKSSQPKVTDLKINPRPDRRVIETDEPATDARTLLRNIVNMGRPLLMNVNIIRNSLRLEVKAINLKQKVRRILSLASE